MICSETREYLFAFLDSELDAPLSIELQRHAERCHDCAHEMEIERTIRRQLGVNLDAMSAGYALDEDALKLAMTGARVVAPPLVGGESDTPPSLFAILHSSFFRRPRGVAFLAAAAAILVVFTSLWIIGPRSESGRLGERFAILVVNDFQHFLEEGQHLQVASADSEVVTDWLRTKTKLEVILPPTGWCKNPFSHPLHGSDCRLVGGRKCKIEGHVAAFAVYEVEGLPVSILAVADKGDAAHGERREVWNLEGMTSVGPTPLVGHRFSTGGGSADLTYWVDSLKDHTVVAWRRGGLTYAAVSTLSKEKLLSLITGALHEGD